MGDGGEGECVWVEAHPPTPSLGGHSTHPRHRGPKGEVVKPGSVLMVLVGVNRCVNALFRSGPTAFAYWINKYDTNTL